YPWSLGLEERAENDTRAPHVAAAGPLLSTVDHWLNLPAERQFTYLHDEASAQAAVASLKASGARFVKVWFIVDNDAEVAKLEPLVRAAGDAARAAGLPLIVHATGLAQAKGALRAGAHLLVHSVWEQPIDQEFLDLAKTSGAIYCPTLTVESGYLRLFKAIAAGKAPEIDDPGHCVDAQTRAHVAESATLGADILKGRDLAVAAKRSAEHSRWAAENLMRVQAAGIPIAMGTDAGNPLTFQGPSVYAEMEAMQAAGLSPKQVLLAATRGGAKAMGREKDLGTLEAGKQADLLVLDADPLLDIKALRRLRYVVRGGEVRPAAELRAADAPAARPKP
ncbi:MAG: amidohydrolase family protein, partial [Acidobacteriota bacterium]